MTDLYINGLPDDEVIENLSLDVDDTASAEQTVAWGWRNPETPVFAKRCFRFYPPDGETISAITTAPTRGKAIINSDNTITVQLTEYTLASGQEAQTLVYDTDSSTVTENYAIVPAKAVEGWHNGDTYFQRLDADGNQVIEYDDNVRTVYVAEDGMSRADIATDESLTEGEITAAWLATNFRTGTSTYYGDTEALRLDEVAGRTAWAGITNGNNTSARLLFKGGDTFNSTSAPAALGGNAHGFNDRFPLHVNSYGTGRAEVRLKSDDGNPGAYQCVLSNMDSSLMNLAKGAIPRISLERINGVNPAIGGNQNRNGDNEYLGDGVSVYRCTVFDGWKAAPNDPNEWSASGDRVTPFFWSNCVNMYFAENVSDSGGQQEGYNPYSNLTAAGWYRADGDFQASDPSDSDYTYYDGTKQPPSQFSQGSYFKLSNGFTRRSNFFCRPSFVGSQLRSGGTVLGDVYVEGNGSLNLFGGEYNAPTDQSLGNYSFAGRNINTSAGFKRSISKNGLADNSSEFVLGFSPITMDKNIHMHARNPDDLAGEAFKDVVKEPFRLLAGVSLPYDNNIVYEWTGSTSGIADRNIDGLNTSTLDTTTIQRFADDLKSEAAGTNTITTLMNYARDTMTDPWSLGKRIARYFYDACGVDSVRTVAGTVTFLPTEWADGLRWDVYKNWDIEQVPGTDVKDDIDLNGYDTRLGCGIMFEIADLDFGNDGSLVVNNTQLTLDTLTTTDGTATMEVERCGNIKIAGTAAPTHTLTVNISTDGNTGSAGRLVVTGSLSGDCDVTVDGHGQFFGYDGGNITINGTLTLTGALHRVGFDGTAGGASSFTMPSGSTLVIDGNSAATPAIREIWSGMNGDSARSITSTFVCGGTLDLTDAASGTYDLIVADTVTGTFATVIGGSVISYAPDRVTVTVT